MIGSHGGNITAIDVQRSGEKQVVDELAVEFSATVDIGELRREISDRTGATLISHQTTVPIDPVLRVVRQLGNALGDPPAERADRLCHRIAELLGTPATWVLDRDVAAGYVAGRAALDSPGVGCVRRSTEELPSPTETLGEDVAVLAIALREGTEVVTILAARDSVQGFNATEVTRVEAMVEFHQRLADKDTPA